jgi:hypothetical protein
MTKISVNESLILAQSEAILAERLVRIERTIGVELFLAELEMMDRLEVTPFGPRLGQGFDTYQYVKVG